MEKNYKILAKFIKDMSVETNNIQTYLFVKDIISRYHLTIAINSKAIKNKMIEIDTNLKLEDKEGNEYRSNFDMVFCTIIKIKDENLEKKDLEKILLVEVQNEIYPELEKALLDTIHNSGFGEFKINKKIDFTELYKKQFS